MWVRVGALGRQKADSYSGENTQSKDENDHDPHGDERESAHGNWRRFGWYGLPVHGFDYFQIEVETTTNR